jgi:hypothetical protein
MNGRQFLHTVFGVLLVMGGIAIVTGRMIGPATAAVCYGSVLVGAVGTFVMRFSDRRD